MTTFDLNGLWHFAVDQDPEYHRGEDYSRPFSLRYWETAPVPGCWNRYGDRYDLFEGVAWFVREFDVPALPEAPVARLHFGAVNYLADVYLNGTHVGTHEGGYTAFDVDVSAALQPGHNRLAVRVDNRHLKIRLPAVLGWYNYGGIHRDVTLTISDRAQVTALRITAQPEDDGARGTITVRATATESLTVTARILEPSGALVFEGQAAGDGNWQVPFTLDHAEPWSPETPRLYSCEIELCDGDLVLDARRCTFGIRALAVNGQQIMHNGQSLYLRGMCYLYDHPATGVAVDPAVIARDLDDLQALGVNCLRSHFPLPESVLDACDRRGMLLWLEVPIYCMAPPADGEFAAGSVQALALQMLREMIEQAANHPSVIIWSVGNECDTDHPGALAFFRACVEQVRTLDPTRLISYAALYGGVGCAADLVDIIGINEYWGWYDRISYNGSGDEQAELPIALPALEACLAEKAALGKPMLLTEFGADAVPGYRSAACELWSEDYQAALLASTLEIAARYPTVRGVFPFLYADYRDPSKPINHHWHGINLKGIVDYHRNRKLAWQAVGETYRT